MRAGRIQDLGVVLHFEQVLGHRAIGLREVDEPALRPHLVHFDAERLQRRDKAQRGGLTPRISCDAIAEQAILLRRGDGAAAELDLARQILLALVGHRAKH
jgi:hypothetical protein